MKTSSFGEATNWPKFLPISGSLDPDPDGGLQSPPIIVPSYSQGTKVLLHCSKFISHDLTTCPCVSAKKDPRNDKYLIEKSTVRSNDDITGSVHPFCFSFRPLPPLFALIPPSPSQLLLTSRHPDQGSLPVGSPLVPQGQTLTPLAGIYILTYWSISPIRAKYVHEYAFQYTHESHQGCC